MTGRPGFAVADVVDQEMIDVLLAKHVEDRLLLVVGTIGPMSRVGPVSAAPPHRWSDRPGPDRSGPNPCQTVV